MSHFTGGRFLPLFRILFCAVLVVFSLGVTGPARAANGEAVLAKKYDIAKAQFQNLQQASVKGQTRDEWDEVIGGFRKVYLANPRHELATSSLFMMGRMYHEMYLRFKNPLDFGEAIAYYQDVAGLFPDSNLADDALYKLGRIYLAEKNDRVRAANAFSHVLERYPRGDMAEKATRQLASLKDVTTAAAVEKTSASGKMVEILPVRFWSSNNYTRVAIKTTGPVRFSEQLLEASMGQPRRLFIDFPNSRLTPEARFPVKVQDGFLKQVRSGQHTPDTARVVLDIESISRYKIFTLQDPFRVVIDVMGGSDDGKSPVVIADKGKRRPGQSAVSGESAAKSPTAAGVGQKTPLSLARQLGLCVNRIVIDPGHGGKDPGAIGPNGIMEKDVVLAVGLKLAEKLRKTLACEVILTRTTDVFIPLEERTAIANTRKGDLFISLHVNSAPQPTVHGVETYLLDLTNDKNSMRLAALENATSASNMSDLQNILADLLNNNKKDESAKLASAVQQSMVQGLNLKDLGVKRAPFYVLIGAEMPAILSEITFLSNPREAERLRQDSYLDTIAEQIASGISGYVSEGSVALLK